MGGIKKVDKRFTSVYMLNGGCQVKLQKKEKRILSSYRLKESVQQKLNKIAKLEGIAKTAIIEQLVGHYYRKRYSEKPWEERE